MKKHCWGDGQRNNRHTGMSKSLLPPPASQSPSRSPFLSLCPLSLSLCLSICWYWLIGSQLAMLKCHLQSTKASSRWARSWNNSLIIETTLLLSSYPSFPPVFTSLSVQLQINYKPFSYSLADIINSFVPNKQIGSTDYPPNPTHTSHYISLGNLFVYTLQRLLQIFLQSSWTSTSFPLLLVSASVMETASQLWEQVNICINLLSLSSLTVRKVMFPWERPASASVLWIPSLSFFWNL